MTFTFKAICLLISLSVQSEANTVRFVSETPLNDLKVIGNHRNIGLINSNECGPSHIVGSRISNGNETEISGESTSATSYQQLWNFSFQNIPLWRCSSTKTDRKQFTGAVEV